MTFQKLAYGWLIASIAWFLVGLGWAYLGGQASVDLIGVDWHYLIAGMCIVGSAVCLRISVVVSRLENK